MSAIDQYERIFAHCQMPGRICRASDVGIATLSIASALERIWGKNHALEVGLGEKDEVLLALTFT